MSVNEFIAFIIKGFFILFCIYIIARIIFEAWFKTKKQNTGGINNEDKEENE